MTVYYLGTLAVVFDDENDDTDAEDGNGDDDDDDATDADASDEDDDDTEEDLSFIVRDSQEVIVTDNETDENGPTPSPPVPISVQPGPSTSPDPPRVSIDQFYPKHFDSKIYSLKNFDQNFYRRYQRKRLNIYKRLNIVDPKIPIKI